MQNDIPDRLGSPPVDSGYLHAASDYYEIDSHALTNRHYLRTPWWNTSGKFDIRKKKFIWQASISDISDKNNWAISRILGSYETQL